VNREAFREEFSAIAAASGIIDSGYYDALLNLADQVQVSKAFTISVGGAQGSGKSTVAELLAVLLDKVFGQSANVLSLDDFYKTKEERMIMAGEIHPLFLVRGVPGTHDMRLMNSVVEKLKSGEVTNHPRFNKADDDRLADWETIGLTDVLILEGWCWGARSQSEETLIAPVNDLERNKDVDGVWRREVNTALNSDDYQRAFDNDLQVFLSVPNMEAVYRWRLQQEQGLQDGSSIMDEAGIREFIMYYERITRAMLIDSPASADVTLFLNEAHQIESLQNRYLT
jgi:D-glycerate 3-kinase